MKKTKDFCLWLMCCFLFLGLFCGTEVFAAVQEGKPGETFSGEYAVIINTDTTNPGNTGTLQFDGTSAQAADSEAEDYAVVQGGSNASAQAATEGTAGEAADVGQVQSLEDDQLQAYMQDDQPMLTAVQAAATTYQVGEKKYIYRTNGHDTYGKTYVCIGVGEHCYVWMDETLKADYDTAGKTSLIAADMAAVYDGQPYRILNQLCAGDFPAQDGSGKLSILLESLSSASGMYMYDEGITAIHINTPSASSYVSGEMSKRNGLLVHEGQHAILWLKTGFMSTGRYSWLNEGLAVAVMDYLWGGTDSSGWLNGIGSNTAIRSGASLIYENYRDDNAQDYGMPYLFVRYVIDRMAGSYQPMKVLPKFYTIDASSLSCEQYLEKVTGVSFKELMADFYTAVAAGESSGKYSFYGDTIAAAKAATFPVYAGDSNENHTLPAASDVSETPDDPETQDTSEIPEEIELPENEEADIPQEMLPDDQEDQPEAAFEESAASEDMETETDPAEEKSGFCGAEENTVSWSLDENGVLEIAGQGAMNEWQNEEEVPWNGYRDQITEVRIEEGVTSIGAYAFADCEKLVKLDIADSVQTIGAFAYFNCSGLSTLTIG